VITPFTLELAGAFGPAICVTAGPWVFLPRAATMFLCGRAVAPCGWADLETFAWGDPYKLRWLASLREDVERGRRIRAHHGPISSAEPS
jgi:hypothetical protein